MIRSVKISDAVQYLAGNLKIEPGFVITKGGITSGDVGTKALRVKRATVMGQIRPGIPVWQTGEESRFPLSLMSYSGEMWEMWIRFVKRRKS